MTRGRARVLSALHVVHQTLGLRPMLSSAALALTLVAPAVSAQIPFVPAVPPSGVVNAFPAQNTNGPRAAAFQTNYPYPGQCLADPANAALFPLLPPCTVTSAPSFAAANLTAGGWMWSGGVFPFKVLNPVIPATVPLAPATVPTPKFVWEVLNPPDYSPDTLTFPGADYYEIGVHEAWGFQALASAGLFPMPPAGAPGVPEGMQWTGLVCNGPACSCPAGVTLAPYCANGVGSIPAGAPLYTPIWGVGQINAAGGPVTQVLTSLGLFTPRTPSAWSANNYVATWPSISIRGTKGRPVVVKWVNEFPNNHVFCPHPEAADWPCAIDRTFMGVKPRIDPALAVAGIPPDGVNEFGSPQQPDNSWVTHLHGGEIPPSTDGFAEKWYGNAVSAARYTNVFVNPPFDNPSGIHLRRPTGNFDVYTYPMVQEEALIWFHDHTLGKTHHNVIAGPAGFFPVKEPEKHGGVGTGAGVCPTGLAACTSEYTWLDPLTEPRDSLNRPLYDLFLAIQDRAFNDDGSINFSNGLGQVIPAGVPLPVGYNPITAGVNPQVHPTWVPEYFGDHVLVNGVLWPKRTVQPGWYRIRLVDGSDSRCWTIGFSTKRPAPGGKPTENVPFYVIANDQGYLRSPVFLNPMVAPAKFTICPGERYELLINFALANLPGIGALPASVYMTNEAAAPFPAGIKPTTAASPFAEMNVIMRFDVNPAAASLAYGAHPPLLSCGAAANNWDPTWTQAQMLASIGSRASCIPSNPALVVDPSFVDIRPAMPFGPGNIVRQVYLNERLDGVTLAPMGMQLNGVPFEYRVTETPRKGTREVWQFVNLTVDAHPMHPHLVKHQVVARQTFSVNGYKKLLCGSTTCQPGTAPGGEMQVVPDVTPLLTGAPVLVTAASVDGGWKDATQAMPGQVTTIVADWGPNAAAPAGGNARWGPLAAPGTNATAPGTAGCPAGAASCAGSNAATWTYEDVTTGPYVWHCHINSHEDSEMMHTSLVVP